MRSEPATDSGGRAHAIVRTALLIAAFTFLAVVETGIGRDGGRSFFAGADPIIDLWTLRWTTANLFERPLELFEANNLFPARDVLLFSDPLFGLAILVSPIRMVTANPVLLYNGAVLLSLVLCSIGAYRLALFLTASRMAAVFAAIVVPYSPYQSNHLTHLNLLAIFGFPFLLFGLLLLLQRPGPLSAVLTGVAFFFQAGTSGYHAFSCLFLCLIVAAWGWRRLIRRRTLAWCAVAGLLALLPLTPYVLAFRGLRQQGDWLSRTLDDNTYYSLDVGQDLLGSRSYLWRGIFSLREKPLFPGAMVPVFAVVALMRRRTPEAGLLALVAAFFFVLALGPDLRFRGHSIAPLPFQLLFKYLPFFNAGRHPNTFIAPAFTALGILAAIGVAASGLTRRRLLMSLVLVFTAAEYLAPPPRHEERSQQLPDAYAFLIRQPPGAWLELPFDLADNWQWWSTFHARPIVNGSSVFEPPAHTVLSQQISRQWRRRPVRDLEGSPSLEFFKSRFPVRYLLVHVETRRRIRRNVEASRRSFEPLYRAANGDRVYLVRRGGRGRVIPRVFRDDQLRTGPLVATVRGPAGSTLVVEAFGRPFSQSPLTAEWQEVRIVVPPHLLARGPIELTLRVKRADAELELFDIAPLESIGSPDRAGRGDSV